MKLKRKTIENLKALFFSFALTVGIYVALEELHVNQSLNRFILFTGLIFFIYIGESILNWKESKNRVELNLNFNDDVNELSQFFYKIILPIALYLSVVGFGYFNIKSSSLILLLVAIFITFFVLFINIRLFFESKTRLESKTHYVYDLIKFIIFFCITNILSNISNNLPANLLIYTFTIAIVTFTLISLMLWRFDKFHLYSLVYGLIVSIFCGIVFFLYHKDRIVNSLQISLGLFFVFYLTSAIVHHSILKTLSKGVLLEYFLVITIVIAITYGIA